MFAWNSIPFSAYLLTSTRARTAYTYTHTRQLTLDTGILRDDFIRVVLIRIVIDN